MIQRPLSLLFVLLFLLVACSAMASTEDKPKQVCLMEISGGIGPATTQFIRRALDETAENDAQLLIITMDTPGGLSAATRDIVKLILNASTPVAVFVHPEGARAASAGTYILYSAHVAAMAPACTVGAATPVQLGGGGLPGGGESEKTPPKKSDDQASSSSSKKKQGSSEKTAASSEKQQEKPPQSAKKQKVLNDAVAFMRGLADKRDRNADWAEKAVREAASIKSSEAKEKNVTDFIAADPSTLLKKVDGYTVKTKEEKMTLHTADSAIIRIEPTWRTKILSAITNPNLAYILLIIGIYGLLLEGYNPGAMVPGIVGAISLLIAFYALQILPVNFAGVALIIVGAILMVAEAFVPSFGALGLGGVVAIVTGGIFLISPDTPGFGIDPGLVSAVGVATGLVFLAVTAYLVRAKQRPIVAGREELVGNTGYVISDFTGEQGTVFVRGERWRARASQSLKQDEPVRVTGMEGLTLFVETENGPKQKEGSTCGPTSQ